MNICTRTIDDANVAPIVTPIMPDAVASRCQPTSLAANKSPPGSKDEASSNKAPKRKRRPKAADAPRRPLSAYNLFFKHERALIVNANNPSSGAAGAPTVLIMPTIDGSMERAKKRIHRKTHGKIGFADLARQISEKWKTLDAESRSPFEKAADIEKMKYKEELKKYNEKKKNEKGKPIVDINCKPAKKAKASKPTTSSKDCPNNAPSNPLPPMPVTSTQTVKPNDTVLLDDIDESIWEDTSCTKTLFDVLGVASEMPIPDFQSNGKDNGAPAQDDIQLDTEVEELFEKLEKDTPLCGKSCSVITFNQQSLIPSTLDVEVEQLFKKLEKDSAPVGKPFDASALNLPTRIPSSLLGSSAALNDTNLPTQIPSSINMGPHRSLLGSSAALKYPMSNQELFKIMMMPYLQHSA